MYRGTTPYIIFHVNDDTDLNEIDNLWITFKLASGLMTFTKKDVSIDNDERTIILHLSQEDTLKFNLHHVDVQIRFLMTDGESYSTKKFTVIVDDVLQDGVIGPDE